MRVFANDAHRAHFPSGEIYNGELVRPFECPERWDHIDQALTAAGMTERLDAAALPLDDLAAVHDPAYVEFLDDAWTDWTAAGNTGDMIPTCFPARRMVQRIPDDIDGRLGYFAFAAETAITSGTWSAAHAAASLATAAARSTIDDGAPSFALCRPPGHHASKDFFGGYCFINNAAVAATTMRRAGAERVAVVDVDFHHGNGTQDIFWNRRDVFFGSVHGDPAHEFPHFSGFADEIGDGDGMDATCNRPLPPGTDAATWFAALDDLIDRAHNHGTEALVVSLGVDTFENDPISSFRLASRDFFGIGQRLAALDVPTVYCMEGGYAVDEIGTNVVNVLHGHEGLTHLR